MGIDNHGYSLRAQSVTALATTPATLIVPLNPKRSRVTIENSNTVNTVWLGPSTVTVGNGIRVLGGGEYAKQVLTTKAAIYGIGTPGAQEVTWLEEYE